MKKQNVIFALLLALVVAITPFAFTEKQSASAEKNYSHYYSQLDSLARNIYDTLVDVSNADTDFSCDSMMELADVSSELADYFNGGSVLYDALSDAKKAIMLDCPEACFIDFDKIDLIVSQDTNGNAKAYVGAVRDNSYKNNDFVTENVSVLSAVTSVTNVIETLIEQTSTLSTDEKIKAVSNYLSDKCTIVDSTQPFADNAYGALVRGKATPFGYASALKLVLDNMGINCVTVNGLVRVDGQLRYHSWNVVQYVIGTYIVDSALCDEMQSNAYVQIGSESLNNTYYPCVTLSDKVATMPALDFGNGVGSVGENLLGFEVSSPQTMPATDVKKPTLIEQEGFFVTDINEQTSYPKVLASKKYDGVSMEETICADAYKISLVGENEVSNVALSNGVKVMFPFPKGYGEIDDVSYRAYALGLNGDGTIDYTQKTALESVVTSYGIIVNCNKMGAMAITVQEKTDESKKVVVAVGRGGQVDRDWATLGEDNVDFTVTPNAGKSIESIVINDQRLNGVVELGHAFTLKPDECDDVTIVEITFADTQVLQQNHIDGIKTAIPVTPDFDLTIAGETTFDKGDSRVLTAENTAVGEVEYRWYKDGVLIGNGESITVSEEGNYKLVVSASVGQKSVVKSVVVAVSTKPVLTWVWILAGVLVFVLLIATIGFIYVKRAGKVDDEEKEEEVPVDMKNRIADGKTAVKVSQEKKEAKIAQEIEEERRAKEEEERIKEERAHEPLPNPEKMPVDKKEAKRIKRVTSLYNKDAPWDKKVDKILKKKDKEELKKDPNAKIKRASVTTAKLSLSVTKTAKFEIQPKEEKPNDEREITPVKKNNGEGDNK